MKKITIADVAAHAGVSKSTVSQYLNERYDYMGKATKDKVKAAIEELGYQPNAVARSLKQKSTKTIGVIVANILHTFSTEVSRAIEDVCNEEGFHTIVCNADDDPDKEKRYIEMLRAKQVDGLIVFPTGNNRDLYRKMVEEDYPIILLDRWFPDIQLPAILLENELASMLAVDHFVEKGYRKFGLITTSILKHITPRQERLNGFEKALEKHGLQANEQFIRSASKEDIQASLHDLLQQPERPEAILAGNDLVLTEVLKYVKQHQLSIPEDLALIGIDDVPYASFYTPAITTVAQPTFKMGKMSAEILLKKIVKKSFDLPDHEVRFQPTLMVRDSV
ncbi:substrate-binding domain-containing protein [Halobacillus litoralis]|uniref:LacI family DNA-binding transcriptional regulator n=1 Tax=Halobacillus litoralis TaxID=45668 RepID=UPI001CD3F854|nr:substrate-binding domain-containing protein [Halobacillus litoralis]MCA0972157.1 substrate-binding domain-containing protein [Halobacillus litoralis]